MTSDEALEVLGYLLGHEKAVDSGEMEDVQNCLNSQEQEALSVILSEFRELKEKEYDCDIKHLFGECSYAETGCSDCIGKLKIKDALEKAMAKKPIPYENTGIIECPHCYTDISDSKTKWCCICGQHLDWSEGKE